MSDSEAEIIREFERLVERLRLELKKKDAEIALLRANLEEIIQADAGFREFVDAQARHIRSLIVTYSKRLRVLEQQQALKGIDTDVAIILEIQDIRAELEKLYKEAVKTRPRTDFLIGDNGR